MAIIPSNELTTLDLTATLGRQTYKFASKNEKAHHYVSYFLIFVSYRLQIIAKVQPIAS